MKLLTRTIYLPLLLSLLLLSGCIKEDLDDCPTGLKVYFTYEPATYARTGVDPSEVERIDLFAFDAGGILRGVYVDQTPALSPDYYMTVSGLPAGEYTFVAWCGVPTYYKFDPGVFVTGTTRLADALVYLEHQNEVEGGVLPIFHARKTDKVENSSQEQKIYLPLGQAYNTINLTTEGLLQSGDTYRFSIYDNNGRYDFAYSFVPCDDFIYTSLCGKDAGGQLSATLHTLKLEADRQARFEIRNVTRGTVLYGESLCRLINAMGGNDYATTHTYDIHLKFGLDVSVSINGWLVVDNGNIILK